jgi:tyrosinase
MANAPVQIKTRRDVWKLPVGDSTLAWYARAVAAMQTRPASDPGSWQYQANIHGSMLDPASFTQEQLLDWDQCQHATWYFLPWHRMYLAIFEQIVARTVARLGGPAGWALPYWNYSDASNPDAWKLPPAFVATQTDFSDSNPLRVARDQGNDGENVLDARSVSLACLKQASFVDGPAGSSSGFGGPQRGFNHVGDAYQGQLEQVPHDQVHADIGGLMGDPDTAAQDPIFWLHHANIDRLWEVWLRRDPRHSNPTSAQWLTSVAFNLRDSDGNPVTMRPAQVLDTTVAPLFYQYEDVSDPLAASSNPQMEKSHV